MTALLDTPFNLTNMIVKVGSNTHMYMIIITYVKQSEVENTER